MRRALVSIVVALLCTAWPVSGQSTFGSIVGVVHDASQGSITGASVQIRSLEDNSVHSTTADADGSFEFVNLKPGKYALSAQAAGFAEFQVPSAELNARQTLRIDVSMTLETQVQRVEVSDTVAVINTENGIIDDSKGSSEITQLPMNFRAVSTSPLAALQSSPNVQQDSQGNIALGGATANMVGYSVDGISTANIFLSAAGANPYPSSEGIAELKVTAFNNNAEFSQVGDVTFTTKAGTNNIHGSLFEYLQNDALDATVLNFDVKAPKRFSVALAPLDFGRFSHDLLIAQFAGGGDTQSSGFIAAYDLSTGKFDGLLQDASGKPLAVNGIWAISPGNVSPANNDAAAAPAAELYFTAGPNHGSGGLFGYLTSVSAELAEGNDQ